MGILRPGNVSSGSDIISFCVHQSSHHHQHTISWCNHMNVVTLSKTCSRYGTGICKSKIAWYSGPPVSLVWLLCWVSCFNKHLDYLLHHCICTHCDMYWHCDMLVWYFSEKKWRYGFVPAKEVPVWHTIPLWVLDLQHVTNLTPEILKGFHFRDPA